MKPEHDFEHIKHDPGDPNPWLALYLDHSLPLGRQVKAALLDNGSSRSRQFLLPVVRPLAKLTIASIQVIKIFVPNKFTSSKVLHKLIYLGLKTFVRPSANILILRHFRIGSELLEFIAKNTKGVDIPLNPLKPVNLEELIDDVFLKHDLNIYNFIIRFNKELEEKKLVLKKENNIDYSMITDGDFGLHEMPNKWTNFLDLETAIETYTPTYQLFLTDSDFWRACNSLQLDETIALYASRLLGDTGYIGLVNNKHPLIPLSTFQAGYRLLLHGLAAESLHATLVEHKRRGATAELSHPSAPSAA